MRESAESLFRAAEAGDLGRVKEILAAGDHDANGGNRWQVDIDPRGWRRSPLHICVQAGHLALAAWLLENGADPNPVTKFGDTPLNALLEAPIPSHYRAAVELLVAHGADPAIPNDDGETPIERARKIRVVWDAVGPLLSTESSAAQVYVCRAGDGDEVAEYVTVLSPEMVSSVGLINAAIVGELGGPPSEGETISPNRFTPNDAFSQVLQQVVAEHAPEESGFRAEAERVGDGWVYIIDRRTPTPEGPVPPEDIIGGFKVAGGRVVPSSYVANPGHRLLTVNGFFRLDEGLYHRLVAELMARSASGARE